MPIVTINGKQLEFKAGQTIIEVAKENGIEVPHFCWHPSLTVSGNCRMCLVEIERMPKLAIACATLAADGMVINIDSDKAVSARNAVMEFLLSNHPLDCPICDEAGECKLQEYAYKYNDGESRFDEVKSHKTKRVPLGPFVMFDAERCISCSRCIRFCDEIANEDQLTFIRRGDRVTIATFPGKQMDNPYSLNTTDICPVGALTNRDFRFQARIWDMSRTHSVCVGCARGCNDEIWVRNNVALRLTPRYNQEVNSYWMCDYGRINSLKFVNENRIESVFIRKNGAVITSEMKEGITVAAEMLQSFKPSEIAFIASPFATLEDNYMLMKLAKTKFHSHDIFYFEHIVPGSGDDILIREDKSPNATGLRMLGIKAIDNAAAILDFKNRIDKGAIKVVYCLEDDIAGIDQELTKSLNKLELLIVHATNNNGTTEIAHVVLPAGTYAEKNGVIVNFQGRAQRLRPAIESMNMDRAIDNMSMSRLDKFGTDFDKWAKKNKKNSYPSWYLIAELMHQLGDRARYEMSEDVFMEIAASVKIFKDLDYDALGDTGVRLELESKKLEAKY